MNSVKAAVSHTELVASVKAIEVQLKNIETEKLSVMMGRVEDIHKAMFVGNGKPAVMTDLALLKESNKTLKDNDASRRKQIWQLWIAAFGGFCLVVLEAIREYVMRAK